VQPLGGVPVGLPKELAAKEDGRRGSVSRDVVLGALLIEAAEESMGCVKYNERPI